MLCKLCNIVLKYKYNTVYHIQIQNKTKYEYNNLVLNIWDS